MKIKRIEKKRHNDLLDKIGWFLLDGYRCQECENRLKKLNNGEYLCKDCQIMYELYENRLIAL